MTGSTGGQPKPMADAPGWTRRGVALLAAALVAGLGWWAWPDVEQAGQPAAALAPAVVDLAPPSAAGSAVAAHWRAPAASALGPLPAAPVAAVGLAARASTTALPAQASALARCQAQVAAAKRAPPMAEADAAQTWAALQSLEPDEAQLAAAWDRTARQLQGSPQPRQQAAGLLMNRPPVSVASPQASLPASALASLVSLALASADPTVLQWATRACTAPGAQGACQGLSARAWVRAEPDNLLAWLPLLAQQPQAREEALQGMAQARRADGGWMRWANVVNAARPADLAPDLRFAFGQRLTIQATSEPMLAWQGVLTACKDDALSDARRRGQCGQIAQLMVDQGRELITVSLGYAIGKRLGWPAEREQARQALIAAARQAGPDVWLLGISLDCNAQLHEHWLAQVDQLGEAELARKWLRTAAAAASAALAPR